MTLSPQAVQVLLETLEDIKQESCLSDEQMALYVLVRAHVGRPVVCMSREVKAKTLTLSVLPTPQIILTENNKEVRS
ncbi:hypothetical protein [Deinococcus misasensis]|uniref:hypothetical protein n=1 Tax=Deinococcus misasensis TaxID=392413 RepID=UPI000558F68A|nr:hypothetical protein [Deinococcus misasensis]